MFKSLKSNVNKRELLFIFRYIKEYIIPIVIFSIVGIVSTALGLGGSVVTKYMIDAVTGSDSTKLYVFIVMLLVFGTGSILLSALVSVKSAKISTGIYNRIQYDVYKKILGSKWENVEEYRIGDLMNRLSGDVKTVAESVFGLLSSSVIRLTWFVGSIVIIFSYDPTMVVVAVLSTPLSAILSRILMNKTKKYNLELRSVNSKVMNYHEQTFSNLLTIKSLGINRHFEDGMKDVQEEYKSSFLRLNTYTIFTTSVMKFTAIMVSYICLIWSVYRLWKGVIVFGTFTLFLQLTARLTSSLSSLVSLAPQIISASAAAGRILEITELGQEDISDTVHVKYADNSLGLIIDNISFSYKNGNGAKVIKNFSLNLTDNKLVSIIGPSGQGKTTLLKLILGLYNVDSGSISLRNGSENIQVSADTRDYFAYVPQGNTIFAGTVRENLLMVKEDATDDEIYDALKKASAYEFVNRMPHKLDTVIGENGEGISEGQAQRLAIARAFLKNAPFMLLDEATSALDFDTERRVMNSIVNSGIKCILTTHKNSVKDMCDFVISVDSNEMVC